MMFQIEMHRMTDVLVLKNVARKFGDAVGRLCDIFGDTVSFAKAAREYFHNDYLGAVSIWWKHDSSSVLARIRARNIEADI